MTTTLRYQIQDMFGIKDMYGKNDSNKKKHVWNKTHVWKKVFQIRKNMFKVLKKMKDISKSIQGKALMHHTKCMVIFNSALDFVTFQSTFLVYKLLRLILYPKIWHFFQEKL